MELPTSRRASRARSIRLVSSELLYPCAKSATGSADRLSASGTVRDSSTCHKEQHFFAEYMLVMSLSVNNDYNDNNSWSKLLTPSFQPLIGMTVMVETVMNTRTAAVVYLVNQWSHSWWQPLWDNSELFMKISWTIHSMFMNRFYEQLIKTSWWSSRAVDELCMNIKWQSSISWSIQETLLHEMFMNNSCTTEDELFLKISCKQA